jgi:hypothetical protein
MPESEAEQSWEINPGDSMSDPDFSPESWAALTLDEYMMVIANYGDDYGAIQEVLRNMPRALYQEYVELDYPDLPPEFRPDYEEPDEVYDEEEEEVEA